MMIRKQNVKSQARTISFWVGIVLVVFGAFSLLYLASAVAQIISAPEEAGLVKWLLKEVGDNDLVLSGHLNNAPFEIKTSPVVQYISLGIVGLVMVSILSSVVSSLISGGIKLIRFSAVESNVQSEGDD